MIKLHEIPISIKIVYKASEYSNGWPLIRALFDTKIVANFEAKNNIAEFTVQQNIEQPHSIFCLEHYGKNYHNDNSYFEIQEFYINNINLEHIKWECIQYPLLPPWDLNSRESIEYPGNLYLGHNGKIEWIFQNPILLDIQNRLGRTVNQIQGQETTRKSLLQAKTYFFGVDD